MGGEGSMIAMMERLKANRNALRSKRTNNKPDTYSYKPSTPLVFKKISEKKLGVIKLIIQTKKNKENKIRQSILWTFGLIIFIGCIYILTLD